MTQRLPSPSIVAPQQSPGAVILGGAHGSLTIARSLGRRGIDVSLLTDHRLARLSRYVRRSFAWEGPGRRDAAPYLAALARREGLAGAVLFAGGDAEVRFIAQNHAELASVFRLTTPPWDSTQWMLDKNLMYQHAAAIGIDAPRRYQPRHRRDVEELQCRFPLVLKPTVRTQENAFTLAKAWRADDRATLLARYERAAALVGVNGIVLQEFIPGGGEAQYSYGAVYDRGSPVVSMVARRRRQYPIDFGYTSTFVETVERPEVEDAACRFLASLGYTGIAEVEFKYDQRDGRYKILDVNARIWTWAALGAVAGVDFPHTLWRLALGERVAPIRPDRDAAWVHVARDVVAASQEMLRGRLSVAAYLGSFRRPMGFAAFAPDDLLPGIAEVPLALLRAATHRLPITIRDLSRRAARPRRTHVSAG
jgi:predicted ATP-grasp superfamily ATP-dependent carboligase